jgi:hypothetical protein
MAEYLKSSSLFIPLLNPIVLIDTIVSPTGCHARKLVRSLSLQKHVFEVKSVVTLGSHMNVNDTNFHFKYVKADDLGEELTEYEGVLELQIETARL